MDNYLSITQAAQLLNCSEIIIRRFIRQILLEHVEAYTQKIKMEKIKKGYIYKIDKKFLLEQFQKMTTQHDPKTGEIDIYSDELPPLKKDRLGLELASLPDIDGEKLDDQLIKSLLDQLVKKDEQISNLMEQLKEMNRIISRLQERILFLEDSDKTGRSGSQQDTHSLEKKD
ncbi:hypothetical protein ACFL27_28345 [candidate division CSSED10-310 bacterium]|uniref:DNA-binding protein n=1 Tax=candidate division CSSED10-310 bacterium TaxID=2855610 RepID=A0ABV6Z6P1_UNCC1